MNEFAAMPQEEQPAEQEEALEPWHCGFYGHLTKAGKPCRFRILAGMESCQHHDTNGTRREKIQKKAEAAALLREMPDKIRITDLSTSADIQLGFQQVIKAASSQKSVDTRRLDVVIKALNGANAVQQTEAIREQNRILLMLDGHGASLAALQRLKDAPVRPLPKRKMTVITTTASAEGVGVSEEIQEQAG